jgi:acetate kinase
MSMKILVINCGSSSLKYKLFDMRTESELATGLIERMGTAAARVIHQAGPEKITRDRPVRNATEGVACLMELLTGFGSPPPLRGPEEIRGVGHRVVHGAEDFAESVIVDDRVLAAIERCVTLAPLHNPANLAGLRAAGAVLPDKPHVAVFDTAFFQTMPPAAYLYAVPHAWYTERRIRRYGFHGTSHRFVAGKAAELLGKSAPNLITLHLGNGCSMTCIREGKAIDQSMGLTPLEGLMMGTRSGDIDPAIIFHLVANGMPLDEVRTTLEKKSGLLGLSGVSNDLRDVEAAAAKGNPQAELALEVFAHRARKYIGAYLAELGHCDAIIFTGGIGENGIAMRARIMTGLAPLGMELDPQRNDHRAREPFCVSTPSSRTAIWVIPTDEERLIARDTARLVG